MPQTSLSNHVQALDRAGLLTRYLDEKRVDEVPMLMEQHPDIAVFVERVKDSHKMQARSVADSVKMSELLKC
jgi:2,5-furandicarboxylate decarboxylase 1